MFRVLSAGVILGLTLLASPLQAAPAPSLVQVDSGKLGGAATDGVNRILDVVPATLHQRTPLVIGSKQDVEFVAEMLREHES